MRNDLRLSFVIDDYGPTVSKKAEELCLKLTENKLDFRRNIYNGDKQYCGGWVDFGIPTEYHNYTCAEVDEMYYNCHGAQYKCLSVYEGKVLNCSWGLFGASLDIFPKIDCYPSDDQIIDLFDNRISVEEKSE